jgi:hypothetical protein
MAVSETPQRRLIRAGEGPPIKRRWRKVLAALAAGTAIASGALIVRPTHALAFTPPTAAQVQASIAAAIAYLRPLQQVNGSWDTGAGIPVSETAFALIAFGTFDGGNYASLSASDQTQVTKGVQYLLSAQDTTVSDQAYGAFPDGGYITFPPVCPPPR